MGSASVRAKGAAGGIQKYSFLQPQRGCTAVNISSDVLRWWEDLQDTYLRVILQFMKSLICM